MRIDDPDPTRSSGRRVPGWVTVGLLAAVAAALGRAATLVAMEHLAHGEGADQVRFRLGVAAPWIAAGAAASTLAGAALAALAARVPSRWGRAGRVVLSAAVALALAAWLLAWGAGLAGGDPSRRVGLTTERGRQACAALAVASALLAVAVVVAAGRLRPGRGGIAAAAALALVLAPAAARTAWGRANETMVVRQVVADLLAGPPRWSVVRARDDGAPRVEVLSPATDFRLDGSDVVSLVVPPPGEVVIPVDPEHAPSLLALRAGVDMRTWKPRKLGDAAAFAFEVEVGGSVVFEAEVRAPEDGRRQTEWVAAPPIEVRDGDAITLRTRALDADGREVVPPAPLEVGFGGLRLERELARERTRSSPERPNVVLVVMDTLRADRLSVYGYERPTSPNLERLAARGLVYDRAFAASSWTWPSTASILTGLLPQEHGVLDDASCFLAQDLATLPEALQRAGTTTAGWSANLLISSDKNFDQGFEFFDGAKGSVTRSDVMVPAALEWMRAYAGTRFFVYLQMLDPHSPLDPLPEARARFAPDVPYEHDPFALDTHRRSLLYDNCGHTDEGVRVTDRCVSPEEQQWIHDLYDACVWSGDHWVGVILDELRALGLDDETVVIFTSDHGEELFDHGLAAHGHSLHEELVRVPLILAGPGVPRGVRTDAPVSNRFLATTIARIGGTDLPGVGPGPDLALPETADAGGEVLYMTRTGWWKGRFKRVVLGMRRGDRVLHFAPRGAPWGVDEPPPGGDWALYDLSADPREDRDVSAVEPDVARAMRDELERRSAELEARRVSAEVGAGAATMERLRAIGYTGD